MKRRLEIARALATNPKLICLDEPAAGFNPAEKLRLMELIRKIRDLGYTVLVVEHDMKLVMTGMLAVSGARPRRLAETARARARAARGARSPLPPNPRRALLLALAPAAHAADSAFSAAYALASAAHRVTLAQTGGVGSIGVVMRHVDFSRALAADGIKVTHIYAGDHKVDGNPYEPLPASVRADLQAEIDSLYTVFVDAVVRNRGLNAQAVRNTQANTYRGQAAVSLGLADRVATTDQLIAELAAKRARSFQVGQTARATANQGDSMSGTTQAGGQQSATTAAAAAPTFTQADIDAARAEGHTAGAAAERDRITQVRAQSLPGHEALIEKLAFDGKTTGAEAATVVLKAERDRLGEQAAKLTSDAPKPLALVPAATVEKPAAKAMTKHELDAAAKAHMAANPGTDYLAAVKAVQSAQA